MTPAELNRVFEALRIKLKQLEHGERVGYWHLMELLDQDSPELSRALDGELHRLAATGELVFVEDEKGIGSMVERRGAAGAKKKVVKKKVVKKKTKPAPKKKTKPAPRKKAPGAAQKKRK